MSQWHIASDRFPQVGELVIVACGNVSSFVGFIPLRRPTDDPKICWRRLACTYGGVVDVDGGPVSEGDRWMPLPVVKSCHT